MNDITKDEALRLAIDHIENEDYIGTCSCTANKSNSTCFCYKAHKELLDKLQAALMRKP